LSTRQSLAEDNNFVISEGQGQARRAPAQLGVALETWVGENGEYRYQQTVTPVSM
jgi:hypothetical protein